MKVSFRLIVVSLVFVFLPILLRGKIEPGNSTPVPCDGAKHAFVITNTGDGFGATRDDALADARSQAKKKNDIEQDSITCVGAPECKRSVEATTPDYDSVKPAFKPWPNATTGPGFEATATISREISVTCKK